MTRSVAMRGRGFALDGRVARRGIRRVLLGIDYSAPSLAAARWVARCLAPDAELVLAHVVPVPEAPAFLRGFLPPPGPDLREAAGARAGALEGLAATLGARRILLERRIGEPAVELADAAAAHDVDLVCVGARQRRVGAASVGRGTVERLLRATSVPLLQATGALDSAPANLLVALDGSSASRPVLERAHALATQLEARLTALHVIDEDVRAFVRMLETAPEPDAPAPATEAALWDATADWLASLLEVVGTRPVRSRTMVGAGDAATEILSAAVDDGSDLVVVGRSDPDASAGARVGRATRDVLRAAPCPVLVLPCAPAPARPPGDDPDRRRLRRALAPPATADAADRRGAAARHDAHDGLPPAARARPA